MGIFHQLNVRIRSDSDVVAWFLLPYLLLDLGQLGIPVLDQDLQHVHPCSFSYVVSKFLQVVKHRFHLLDEGKDRTEIMPVHFHGPNSLT